MTTIVTRTGKGAPLTWLEADANFINLNNAKLEAGTQASNIANTPSGNISSTNLQDAVNELDADKVGLDALSANTGASLVGFLQSGTGAVSRTALAKLREVVSVKDFGAVGDGVTDDTAAIQAAIDYVASLSGPAHDGSMSISNFPYGVVRVLDLCGLKFAISDTITLKNSVSLFGNGGGFLALSGFPAAAYMLDLDGVGYCGSVQDLVIDGNDLNVKGIRIRSAFNTRWRNIAVSNCRNDGITYTNGAEFMLDQFTVDCSASPVSVTVAGLKLQGSDAIFTNGTCRFNPIGVHLDGGGNHEFVNIHCWGLYQGQKQYINFYVDDSYRNSFVSCYADSPTKQDYAQGNAVILNGIPNGGVGFYFGDGSGFSGAQQNTLVNCRGYVNWDKYTTAALPANQLLYTYYETNALTNSIVNFMSAGGVPAGKTAAYAVEPFGASNTTVRDSNLLFGGPTPVVPYLKVSKDAFGGLVPFIIENTNNGFSGSGGKLRFDVAGVEKGSIELIQGAGGISQIMSFIAKTGRVNMDYNGVLYPESDNTQSLGSASNRWSEVFAGNGTINTSDQRQKQQVRNLSDAEKNVAKKCKTLIKAFKFNDAVSVKGDSARIHFGAIAQEIKQAFEDEGLDAFAYGLLCYDAWEEAPEIKDQDGRIVMSRIPAGDRFGIRYEQLLSFIIAAM